MQKYNLKEEEIIHWKTAVLDIEGSLKKSQWVCNSFNIQAIELAESIYIAVHYISPRYFGCSKAGELELTIDTEWTESMDESEIFIGYDNLPYVMSIDKDGLNYGFDDIAKAMGNLFRVQNEKTVSRKI